MDDLTTTTFLPGASPLTGSTIAVEVVRVIDTAQIAAGYRHRLGVEVGHLFGDRTTIRLLHDQQTGLSFFDPPILGDGAFYDALARHPGYYPHDRQEFAFAAEYVPQGATVCEVGAGRCAFLPHLPPVDYVGLEFNEAAIAQARGRGITLLGEDIASLAARRPGAFDVTCAFQVVEHVPDPLAFVAAMLAATRPGGRVILAVPNAEGYISRCREILNVPPHHLTWWTDRTWRWVAERLGVASLELRHTTIDEVLVPWARMIVADGLARTLGLELDPVIDETPLRHRIDALVGPTAEIIVSGVRHRADAPALGHSTVAIFTR